MPQIVLQWRELGVGPLGSKENPLHVTGYYLFKDGRHEPDLDNLNTSLADLLAKGGIVKNDKFICNTDGSRKWTHTGVEATFITIKPHLPEPLPEWVQQEIATWKL